MSWNNSLHLGEGKLSKSWQFFKYNNKYKRLDEEIYIK